MTRYVDKKRNYDLGQLSELAIAALTVLEELLMATKQVELSKAASQLN